MDNINVNVEGWNNNDKIQLFKLINQINGQHNKKRWRAEEGHTYFFINEIGKIEKTKEVKTHYDDVIYRYGNYFESIGEAEIELEKRKAYQGLKDYAYEHNETEIDWNDSGQGKFSIIYDSTDNALEVTSFFQFANIGQIYFTSEEVAKDAIRSVGERRIKKYLFGVE